MEEDLFNKKYTSYYLLIGIGLLIYFNSLFNAFVWDDVPQIVYNPIIHSLSNIPRLFMGGTFPPVSGLNPVGAYYRPFATLLFTLAYALVGLQPFFFHVPQVAIHIVNTILIFILLKKFFRKEIAFFASLIFLTHPMQVDSVAYIATIHEPFSFFFGILAFFVSLMPVFSMRKRILLSLLLLCSLLFNETGALWIAALFFYQVIFVRKKNLFLQLCVSVGVSLVVYGFLRIFVGHIYLFHSPEIAIMNASLADRLLTMPAVFFYYIKNFFFPVDSFIAQKWVLYHFDSKVYIPLLFDIGFFGTLLAILVWMIRSKKQQTRSYIFFLLWFCTGLAFHSQIYPLDMTVADHWFYFPMVGLLGLLGIFVESYGFFQKKHIQTIGKVLVIVVICLLSLRTIIQNTYWQNEITLYTHSFASIKGTKVEDMLAVALYNNGQYKEAEQHFLSLIKENPNEPSLYYNLGLTYQAAGNIQQAKVTYQKMILVDHEEKAYASLAKLVLMDEKNDKEVKEIAAEGLQRYPHSYYLWLVTAVAQYRLGDRDGALASAEKAKSVLDTNEIQGIISQMQQGQPL